MEDQLQKLMEMGIKLTTSVPSQPIKSIWPMALRQHHAVSS